MTEHMVDGRTALQLNLRRGVYPAPRIATLNAGTSLRKLGEHPGNPRWWHVEASLSQELVQGYVNAAFLRPSSGRLGPDPNLSAIPACHLTGAWGRRALAGKWAFPLDPSELPQAAGSATVPAEKVAAWLDPARKSHARYWPNGVLTYCNIYAHDFCHCRNVYLPRVWWTSSALIGLAQGLQPVPAWGKTASEMLANELFDWLDQFGPQFGWRRVFDETALQQGANLGKTGLVVAKRRDLRRSGHIAMVLPEHGGLAAARKGGQVLRPVMSQAGARNETAYVPASAWWTHARFSGFAFWLA